MELSEQISDNPREEEKRKRGQAAQKPEGPMCVMCGGGNWTWILWIIIAILIVLALIPRG
mgnify:CR=1 FL=1